MNHGKLYGVGVGPGDKELVTLKALRVLKEADIIMIPVTKNGGRTAYDIVAEYLEGKTVIETKSPMTKDYTKLRENYEKIAEEVEKYIQDGKKVAFITIGDPTIYSTYMQLHEIVKNHGFETEIIPGVTSFCAAAAELGMSLCEREEVLTVIPSNYKDIREELKRSGTKVLMKANSAILDVRDVLREENMMDQAVMVEKCGMSDQKIYRDLNELEEQTSYFSTIIVTDRDSEGDQ